MSELTFISNQVFNKTLDFFGTDTKELFHNNLNSQPPDWEYRNKKVEYIFNKQGFRSQYDFDEMKTEKCIILLGCSTVVGVGVSTEEMLCKRLEQRIGLPVLNFGVSGSSIDVSLYNSYIVKKLFPHTAAIVHGVTSPNRFIHFDTTENFTNYGPWDNDDISKCYYSKFNESNYVHYLFKNIGFKELWKNVPVCEFTFFEEASELLKCQLFTYSSNARDLTNDLSHPGARIFTTIADYICKNIKVSRT